MKALWTSLRRHPISLVGHAFVAFSVLWTITEALSHFFSWETLRGTTWFTVMAVASGIFAIYKIWRPLRVVIALPLTNVSIEVVFGDLFVQNGVTAIPVNEFFDSEIGLPVSAKSLHGIFVRRYFGGQHGAFDGQVAHQLANVPAEVVQRPQGKTRRFPIGTGAVVNVAGRRFLVFALTHTDIATCKASADVPQMFMALAGVWRNARTECSGDALNLPLVGSGLSGVGLPARDLVNIIILSFIDETKRQLVTRKMRIVLAWDCLSEVDLREFKRFWGSR